MIKWYVKNANDWTDPNPVTVSMMFLGIMSVVLAVCCMIPPMHLIVLPIIAAVWAVIIGTARLAPVRKTIEVEKAARERRSELGYYHRNALLNYEGLPDDLRGQVEILTIDDIEPMSEEDVRTLDRSLDALKSAYKKQQELLRRPGIERLNSDIKQLTESYEHSNKTILQSPSR